MLRRPPRSTRTDTRFPYTPLCRSEQILDCHSQELALADTQHRARNLPLVAPDPGFRMWGTDKRHLASLRCDAIPDRLSCGCARQRRQSRRDGGTSARLQKRSACQPERSEEHTSELQSLMRNSYAVFCLKKKKKRKQEH